MGPKKWLPIASVAERPRGFKPLLQQIRRGVAEIANMGKTKMSGLEANLYERFVEKGLECNVVDTLEGWGNTLGLGMHQHKPAAEFLSKRGLVVWLEKEGIVCARMDVLAKIFALFVAPRDHLQRMFGEVERVEQLQVLCMSLASLHHSDRISKVRRQFL